MSRFKKATRQKVRLRMAIDGPAGSGKSLTALRFASCFPDAKIACIEAGENGGLSLYHGMTFDGKVIDFDLLELKNNFAPSEYTAAIQEAGEAGYDVLVIDSLSHAWAGEGGALDLKDRQGGNSFTAWKDVTPMHNRMIDSILQSPCHVIATMRSKTEYVLDEVIDDRGRKKQVPRKIGLAPIQRSGMEYEFTIYCSMDWAHVLTVTKSRCPLIQDAIVVKPGAAFMEPVIRWLESGEMPAAVEIPKRVSKDQLGRIEELIKTLKISPAGVQKALANYGVPNLASLLSTQADEVEARLTAKVQATQAQQQATPAVTSPDAGEAAAQTSSVSEGS